MEDFNPNKPALTKEFFWATFIPDRRPKFKMYSDRGHALNAFQYRDNGILYTWDKEKSEWKEVFRLEDYKAPDNCEQCGVNMVKTTTGQWSRKYNDGHRIWVDKGTDSPRMITACPSCKRRNRGMSI